PRRRPHLVRRGTRTPGPRHLRDRVPEPLDLRVSAAADPRTGWLERDRGDLPETECSLLLRRQPPQARGLGRLRRRPARGPVLPGRQPAELRHAPVFRARKPTLSRRMHRGSSPRSHGPATLPAVGTLVNAPASPGPARLHARPRGGG